MRILAVSDLHSHKPFLPALSHFLEKNKFDLCLITGDFTTRFSDYWPYIKEFEAILDKFNLPWFGIHGNNDPEEIIDYLKESGHNLHFTPHLFQQYNLVGIGWGEDLPPYDLKLDNNTILLTHQPPQIKDSQFLIHNKQLTNAPLLHLAGHIHSWAHVTDIGTTRYINIPTAMNNSAAIIDLPSRHVEFISLPPILSSLKQYE